MASTRLYLNLGATFFIVNSGLIKGLSKGLINFDGKFINKNILQNDHFYD